MSRMVLNLGRTLCLLVAAFLVLPMLVVIPLSFSSGSFLQFPPPGLSTQWYAEFFTSPEWTAALLRSIWVGIGSVAISGSLGVISAYGIMKMNARWVSFTEALLTLPMMVPLVIFGFGLYVAAVKTGIGWGSPILLMFAHATWELPYVLLPVIAALRTTDLRLELAAQVMGASKPRAFMQVTLPRISPAVAGGALLVSRN